LGGFIKLEITELIVDFTALSSHPSFQFLPTEIGADFLAMSQVIGVTHTAENGATIQIVLRLVLREPKNGRCGFSGT